MTTKEPVGDVIQTTGSYYLGGYCADIFCERQLAAGTKLYTHPAHDDTALLRMALEALHNITKHFGFTRLHKSTLADTTVRGEAHKAITALHERLGEKV